MLEDCKTLDDYLKSYGPLIAEQAQDAMRPLHIPGEDPLPDFSEFKRRPYDPQQHAIAGGVAALKHNRSTMFIGEQGVGKTICGCIILHKLAAGKPYRVLVFCPGHLQEKWRREILETVPGASVTIIAPWQHIIRIRAKHYGTAPVQPEWYIIGRDRAKLGAAWRPAAVAKKLSKLPNHLEWTCPKCGRTQTTEKGVPLTMADLGKRQTFCHGDRESETKCGEALFQFTGRQAGTVDRWDPASYIHRRMKWFFDYLILDEAHQEKSATSEQGNAAGRLAASCRKTLALTGTLIGGMAEHVRPLLFRLAPGSLIEEGFTWSNAMPFIKEYGRVETTIKTTEGATRQSYGRDSRSKSSRSERMRPGIMPTLFGRHLLNNSFYLGLSEVSQHLPPYQELVVPVQMDDWLHKEYKRIEDALVNANKSLVQSGNMSLLAAMLQCLLAYPDLQSGWETVGYYEKEDGVKRFVPVVQPKNVLDQSPRAKEKKLIEIVRAEKDAGRQCWVFVQFTETRPVLDRIVKVLKDQRFRVGVMQSSMPVEKREKWIMDKGADYDVVVSHPMLVETGLDLFDKRPGGCNFVSLIWYETGYNLFTLRQASRRAWRLGQRRDCRVYFLYYDETAQAAAMTLMGKKLYASQALEGKFTADGLVAMSGDDTSMELALAQSLNDNLPGAAQRAWSSAAESWTPEMFHEEPIDVPDYDDEGLFAECETAAELPALTDFKMDDDAELDNMLVEWLKDIED